MVKFFAKFLARKTKKFSGRNNSGSITVKHRGGGSKRNHRFIDFRRRLFDQVGVIQRINRDSNRTGFVALVLYKESGIFSYILCPEDNKQGDIIKSVGKTDGFDVFYSGFSTALRNVSSGVPIHNIEIKKSNGAKIARAAGVYGVVVRKLCLRNGKKVIGVKLPSKKVYYVSEKAFATLGKVSNCGHIFSILFKAGQNRWRGIRPHVRGVAMNPVDHPHGGGEGKSSGGRSSVSCWGKQTKGYKTLKFKKKKKIQLLLSKIHRSN